MPMGYGVGDHCLFVIDFLTSSMVGTTPKKIVQAGARRLNTNIPVAAEAYAVRLEKLAVNHRII